MNFDNIFIGRRYWTYILLAGGIVLLLLEMRSISDHVGSDFRIFYNATSRFNANALELYTAISARTLQGFLYPPPAIMLFLPFAVLPVGESYKLFVVLSYSFAFAVIVIWMKLGAFEDKNFASAKLHSVNVILLSAASGPFFAAIVAGQVDIFVLLLCTVHIALISKGRPAVGGFVLAFGFWIKIYPLALLVYALSRPDARRIFLGFLVGLLTVPLVLTPIVPFHLYKLYFLELLPKLSAGTIINIYNQSLAAFFMRLSLPLNASIDSFQAYMVPTSIRLSITIAAVTFIVAISAVAKLTKGPNIPLLAMILSIFAVFAPLGWGHTYVYILPLVYFAWLIGRKIQSGITFVFLAVIYAALLVPAYRIFSVELYLPELACKIFYSRYLFATVFLIFMAAILIRVNWSNRSDAYGSSDACGKHGSLEGQVHEGYLNGSS